MEVVNVNVKCRESIVVLASEIIISFVETMLVRRAICAQQQWFLRAVGFFYRYVHLRKYRTRDQEFRIDVRL